MSLKASLLTLPWGSPASVLWEWGMQDPTAALEEEQQNHLLPGEADVAAALQGFPLQAENSLRSSLGTPPPARAFDGTCLSACSDA